MKHINQRRTWAVPVLLLLLAAGCVSCRSGTDAESGDDRGYGTADETMYEAYRECIRVFEASARSLQYWLYDFDSDGYAELFVDHNPRDSRSHRELYVYDYDFERDGLCCLGILSSGHISLYGCDIAGSFLKTIVHAGAYYILSGEFYRE